MKDRKILFIHIPKTGGSTLHSIINRHYSKSAYHNVKNDREAEKLKDLSKDRLEKIKVVKGHMAFGHHRHFANPESVTYMTMLREPVKRIISNYYFILSRPQHYLHEELKTNNLSLKEYVNSGVVANAENAQVRLLSNNIYVPHGECTREMLEQAKDNLETRFSVASVNELFDETALILQDEFGWKYPYYVRQNVTGHGVKSTDLDEETISTIQSYNALDIELYDHVKKLFQQRVDNLGEPFQKRLHRYRRINRMLAKVARVKRKLSL